MNRSVTALRTVAVDPDYTPLGAPVWVEKDGGDPMRRLMVAQDTGSAIKGAQRADIFVGTGDAAGATAGTFRDDGRMVVLLPIQRAYACCRNSWNEGAETPSRGTRALVPGRPHGEEAAGQAHRARLREPNPARGRRARRTILRLKHRCPRSKSESGRATAPRCPLPQSTSERLARRGRRHGRQGAQAPEARQARPRRRGSICTA